MRGKTVLIIRGCSSSGKSSLANFLMLYGDDRRDCVICEADEFMVNSNGEYEFKPERLGVAHAKCQKKFEEALKSRAALVICSNTNTKVQDFQFYLDKAKEYGYDTFVVVLEKYHNGENTHNIPQTTLLRQKEAIRNSLKLS